MLDMFLVTGFRRERMTLMTDDTHLLERLQATDPAMGFVPNEHRMAAVLSAASTARRQTSNRRLRVWFAVALAGVLTIGAVTPAVADGIHHYLAQTGWFTSPNPPGVGASSSNAKSTESDNSEWIDTSRIDFDSYAASIFPAYIPLPSGFDRTDYATAVANAIRPPARGYMQATGIAADFETYSRCVWMSAWVTADRNRNEAGRRAAASVLTTSATWPATVSTDGGGMVSGFQIVALAAVAGNPGPVEREYALNCPTQPTGVHN
jgi:hypothetical protein